MQLVLPHRKCLCSYFFKLNVLDWTNAKFHHSLEHIKTTFGSLTVCPHLLECIDNFWRLGETWSSFKMYLMFYDRLLEGRHQYALAYLKWSIYPAKFSSTPRTLFFTTSSVDPVNNSITYICFWETIKRIVLENHSAHNLFSAKGNGIFSGVIGCSKIRGAVGDFLLQLMFCESHSLQPLWDNIFEISVKYSWLVTNHYLQVKISAYCTGCAIYLRCLVRL